MTPKLLICEGPCNPNIPFIDERIREGRAMAPYAGMRYTPHVRVTVGAPAETRQTVDGALLTAVPVDQVPDRYACQACGTVRQFGHDLVAIGDGHATGLARV